VPVAIVVAASRNGCIGRDGGLPWHLPADLAQFRRLTLGRTVVMGRRTFESLPARFRPLPDRRNLVLSRDPSYRAAGAETFGDLAAALSACRHDCFVIGGADVYAQALPVADRVYATIVDADVEGDAYFPALRDTEWRRAGADGPVLDNGHAITFQTLVRREQGLYDADAARTPEQRARMERLEAGGVCIFCEALRSDDSEQPVLREGEHWYVTRNRYPYAGTAAHHLIVARRHVTAFDELPDAAGAELWQLRRWLKEQLAPLATATVERSGDMRASGGSIAHLHTHFVTLDRDPPATVRFRLSARARQ
jgi:dihydrofolate reductase/diadenosine tetraphosphate (Ap4A) HIT family hydrolase